MINFNNPDAVLSALAERAEDFLQKTIAGLIRARAVEQLAEPVLYSLLAGGKRLRPSLCLMCAGVDFEDSKFSQSALYAACALECMHTYSLIHDDLPCMDNDDYRRGKLSCHKAFSEWEAVLAGDALNTFAFELLVRSESDSSAMSSGKNLARKITALAQASGPGGMVCGQALDLFAEKKGETRPVDIREREKLLLEIHAKKTAAMMRASCEIGAIHAGVEDVSAYRLYGESLGLVFQISDDILDETGDASSLGKSTGKDRDSGKLTYPAVFGIDESRRLCEELCERTEQLAENLIPGEKAGRDYRKTLASIPGSVLRRQK